MKIAVVGHIRFAIAEPFAGGMEAHCAALCKALSDAGHDIVL
ncbi:MAG: glycosyl transferase family 1, partial [Croceicoccus sp.]|nr:glycosyl transferase family 1 [Croceicoccus sp.]